MTIRILLGGSGSFVLPVFLVIQQSPLEIVGLVTKPDSRRGRGQTFQAEEIAQKAQENNIPVFKPQKINTPDVRNSLAATKADLFLTASYGQFLGEKILNLFTHSCWNLHPSLLPQYRGAAPVHACLRDGHQTTGISLFKMVKAMDAGPIAGCLKTAIEPNETSGELLNRLSHLGGKLAVDLLPKIIEGSLTLEDQDEAQASYAKKLTKAQGLIQWDHPAKTIHNKIRSLQPWPGAFIQFRGEKLNIFESRCVDEDRNHGKPGEIIEITNDKLKIACNPGSISLKKLQKPGKNILKINDFVNGTALATGELLS